MWEETDRQTTCKRGGSIASRTHPLQPSFSVSLQAQCPWREALLSSVSRRAEVYGKDAVARGKREQKTEPVRRVRQPNERGNQSQTRYGEGEQAASEEPNKAQLGREHGIHNAPSAAFVLRFLACAVSGAGGSSVERQNIMVRKKADMAHPPQPWPFSSSPAPAPLPARPPSSCAWDRHRAPQRRSARAEAAGDEIRVAQRSVRPAAAALRLG